MENLLAEDVLTNIIHRLAPRYLAISRCVCKTWCTIIDAHNLLHVDLLPQSLCGIFINFNELSMSEFFSRLSKGPTVSGNFDYLPCSSCIIDHCNGLLLFHKYVVNPATRQSAPLPPCPYMVVEHFFHRGYIVFDPTLSPHYEVFMIPEIRRSNVWYNMLNSDDKLDPAIEELEWPPSPCILHVFSSRTKVWEERSFVREGEAAGNVSDMRLDHPYVPDTSVYCRGVLYVYCQNKYVMSDRMEWVCKDSCSIQPCQIIDGPGPWTLQDINNQERGFEYEDGNNEAVVEDRFEWDSDNDNVIETNSRGSGGYINFLVDTTRRGRYNSGGYIDFLGFHPYKEVIFLSDTLRRGLAYHLNRSKIQDLGSLRPTNYGTEVVFSILTLDGMVSRRQLISSGRLRCIAYEALVLRTSCEVQLESSYQLSFSSCSLYPVRNYLMLDYRTWDLSAVTVA
uniref:F-box domain-containing protein n=1 Tax=Oryza meridionalis TaxID=40149 RepID=A0A0E0DAF9_9ORYZ